MNSFNILSILLCLSFLFPPVVICGMEVKLDENAKIQLLKLLNGWMNELALHTLFRTEYSIWLFFFLSRICHNCFTVRNVYALWVQSGHIVSRQLILNANFTVSNACYERVCVFFCGALSSNSGFLYVILGVSQSFCCRIFGRNCSVMKQNKVEPLDAVEMNVFFFTGKVLIQRNFRWWALVSIMWSILIPPSVLHWAKIELISTFVIPCQVKM